jgi:hypothetical protein
MGPADPGFQRRGGRQELAMSVVQPYSKLRKDLAARDRSLREKVVSLEEAASLYVTKIPSESVAARCRAPRWA